MKAGPSGIVWGNWSAMTDLSNLGHWGNLSVREERGWFTDVLLLLSCAWTVVIVLLVAWEQWVLYSHVAGIERATKDS